jgi:hypothetical protein
VAYKARRGCGRGPPRLPGYTRSVKRTGTANARAGPRGQPRGVEKKDLTSEDHRSVRRRMNLQRLG